MNTEMGDDEVFLLVISLTLFLFALYRWCVALRIAGRSRSNGWPLMLLTPIAGLVFIFLVLRRSADDEVRDDARYIILLLLLGGAWVGVVSGILHAFGVGLREDAAERRNVAAALAWCGTTLGVTILYAGGNTGEGPSLWNNVFSAGVGTSALLLMWLVLEWTARISHSVTIDRDIASGLRVGGFMLSIGIIFGRAVAGDWRSAAHTLNDFVRDGWIASLMLAIAVIVELTTHPTPKRPRPGVVAFGVFPAAVYLAAAFAWVKWLGPWK